MGPGFSQIQTGSKCCTATIERCLTLRHHPLVLVAQRGYGNVTSCWNRHYAGIRLCRADRNVGRALVADGLPALRGAIQIASRHPSHFPDPGVHFAGSGIQWCGPARIFSNVALKPLLASSRVSAEPPV